MMIPILSDHTPLLKALAAFTMLTFRYVVFAGFAYLLFYVIKNKKWLYLKIQQRFPQPKNIRAEVRYSLSTFLIFSLLVIGISVLYSKGYTTIYADIEQHGIGYFIFSIIGGILLHDTYFYWMHRFMHLPRIYKYVHSVHHRFHNPTPWASFAFHPIEAMLEFGIAPLVLFTVPVHPLALLTISIFMTLSNVIGHLGFEIYPKNFIRHKWGQWLNSSTHHNMHHRYNKCNYGLYFNLWDRIMSTNHKKYHETFDEVKSREKDKEVSLPGNKINTVQRVFSLKSKV